MCVVLLSHEERDAKMTQIAGVARDLPPTLQDLVLERIRVCNSWEVESVARHIKIYRAARPDLQATIAKQCDLWSFVWTSSSVLADVVTTVCAACRSESGDIQVVELGAGSGLSSIAALASGASVMSTDLVTDALTLVQLNAVENECARNLRTFKFDWNDSSASLLTELSTWYSPDLRLVIGADVLFLGSNVRPIVRSLQSLLHAHAHTVAMIVDPGRTSREDFEEMLPEYDLELAARLDAEHFATPIACMKLCTIFVVTCKSSAAAIENSSRKIIECARKVLQRAPSLESAKLGYTLPPVKS